MNLHKAVITLSKPKKTYEDIIAQIRVGVANISVDFLLCLLDEAISKVLK